MAKTTRKVAPSELLDEVVLPALFDRLPTVFPDFGWVPDGRGWKATNYEWCKNTFGVRSGRVVCRKPMGFYVYGVGPRPWLSYINGGSYPGGSDFVEAVRRLAGYVDIDASSLDRELTEEQARVHEAKVKRRGLLDAVQAHAQDRLWSDGGLAAVAYLRESRGLADQEIKSLGLGLYPPANDLRRMLAAEDQDLGLAEDAGLFNGKLEGYVAIPWADASGNPFTIHTRWPSERLPLQKDHPGWVRSRDVERAKWERLPHAEKAEKPWKEPEIQKTVALKGEGLKSVPLYFDRVRRSGHKDVVVVEGILDAAVAQIRGDARVIAISGSTMTSDQVRTLAQHKIRTITLVPDPDEPGAKGAESSAETICKAGIACYVAPALPPGEDPDRFIRIHGIDAWKKHVQSAVPGSVYRGQRLLDGVSPDSPALDRDRAVEAVLTLYGSIIEGDATFGRFELLRLLEERTGYPRESLKEKAESISARRLNEEQQRVAKSAIREAFGDIEKGKPFREVTARLSENLGTLQSPAADFPLPFSIDRLEREAREIPPGKPLGWRAVDSLGVELHAGELAVLAARTGHGKTTAMVNLFTNLLIDSDEDADEIFVFYSAEESELRIYHRLLALLASFDGGNWTVNAVRDCLQCPDAIGDETRRWGKPESLKAARERLRSWENRILIVHRPAWSITDIEADARRIASKRIVGAVVADYLQRIGPPRDMSKGRRRDEEVSAIARRLKVLAEELAAPVVTGAQINRKAIEDSSKKPIEGPYGSEEVFQALAARRPQLHHLREGGSEQEADLVLGLMNYAADYMEGDASKSIKPVTRLEVGVLKNRYGPPGTWATLAFEGSFGLIRDPHKGEPV